MSTRIKARRFEGGSTRPFEDTVAAEEQATVYLDGEPHVLYASPGGLEELALGYAYTEQGFTEAWVSGAHVSTTGREGWRHVAVPPCRRRSFSAAELVEAMGVLLSGSRLHRETGGIHMAGALGAGGLTAREDVSRHRAVDRVTGALLLRGLSPCGYALLVSSRITYTLALKAARAGYPVLAGRGAVTSAAVEVAVGAGMGLLGFVRGGRANIYSPAWIEL